MKKAGVTTYGCAPAFRWGMVRASSSRWCRSCRRCCEAGSHACHPAQPFRAAPLAKGLRTHATPSSPCWWVQLLPWLCPWSRWALAHHLLSSSSSPFLWKPLCLQLPSSIMQVIKPLSNCIIGTF